MIPALSKGLKSPGKTVTFYKYVLRFRQPVMVRKINVIELFDLSGCFIQKFKFKGKI